MILSPFRPSSTRSGTRLNGLDLWCLEPVQRSKGFLTRGTVRKPGKDLEASCISFPFYSLSLRVRAKIVWGDEGRAWES